MGKYDNTEGVVTRTMVLFFITDTSWSMRGNKIETLNDAIRGVIPEIQKISDSSADANIKISVLKFAKGAEFVYPLPLDVENFKWTDLTTEGSTDFGAACKLLNEKLSRAGGFMSAAGGSYAPVIFLLSDGAPTDSYKRILKELRKNNWFKNAIKVAIAIGDDAKIDVLGEFTGGVEKVFKVHTPEALRKLIRFVSITSSKVASESKKANDLALTKEDEVVAKLKAFIADELDDSDVDKW
jgi:uncharacterized protein YegL